MRRSVILKVELDEVTESDLQDRHIARSVQDHLRQTRYPDLVTVDVEAVSGVCSGCGETGSAYCGLCGEVEP